MNDSFHIAAETVNVGEKYKTAVSHNDHPKQGDR